MIEIVFYLFFIFGFIYYSKKKNILTNYSGEKHQKFLNNTQVPLIGGIIFLIPIIYFFKNNLFVSLFIMIIFILGFLSDLRLLNSPKKRIILQIFIIFLSVILLNLEIADTRIDLLNYFLQIKIISILFSVFCLMILINGSNFIDGLNGLLLGYFLLIIFILFYQEYVIDINNDASLFNTLIICTLILFFLNIFNILYLGDSGAYLIGFVLGYILISFYNQNNVSPFFIILLLWYPCFENLFSIIRKNKFKNSPINPDDKHLHQLLYFFVNKEFFKNKIIANSFTSLLLNIYNCLVFIISLHNPYNTMFQIILIGVNVIVYVIIYKILFVYRFRRKI